MFLVQIAMSPATKGRLLILNLTVIGLETDTKAGEVVTKRGVERGNIRVPLITNVKIVEKFLSFKH